MRELRRRESGGLEDQHMLVRIRKMILAANDVADAQIGIVGARRQVIGRHAVGAQQRKVLDVGRGLHLLAINSVGEAHHLPALAGHAKAQSKRLSSGGAPIAFLAGKFAHPRIEQPRPLGARSLAVSGVSGREIAVGKPFLKDGLRHLAVQISALGLFVFLVPTQAQPLQPFKNGVDRCIGIAFHIGIVEAQNHRSAVPAGVQPVENESARTSYVKKPGRRGRKTNSRLIERRNFQRFGHKFRSAIREATAVAGREFVALAATVLHRLSDFRWYGQRKTSSSGNAIIDFACNPLIRKDIEGGQCT